MLRPIRCVWIFLIVALGCTKQEEYLEVAREQRAAWNEMADLLATVKDEKSMAAAKTVLEERKPKYEALTAKARALPRPSAEVAARLEEDKYLMKAALDRLRTETARVSKLPGGPEFMQQFGSSSEGLMSAVKR